MFDGSPAAVSGLVEPGRVHRSVYTDPAIFDLEMERVFGRAWIYVGHESQVASPGDYLTTRIGLQPVILCRHRDGALHVLFNRCSHRGAKVCVLESGNARRFECMYHGWSYDTDGRLIGVPVPEGAASGFDMGAAGLDAAPRVGAYRGFVFASCARDGMSFDDYIGPMTPNIDDLVDRAPAGELAFDAGVHRYVFPGNWKLQVENALDSYHVPSSHASTVNDKGEQFARREGDRKGAAVVGRDGAADAWKGRRSYVVGAAGHGWTSNTALDESGRSSPAFDAYKAALAAAVGRERAAEILAPRFHNSLLYPSVTVMGLNVHVRVILPVAVDRTEIRVYPLRFKGAPDAINRRNVRLLNVTHSAASFVQTDDMEAFARTQAGLASRANDWVDVSRGLGEEVADPDRNATEGSAMHELVVRQQYAAWLRYMRGDA